MSNRRKTKYNRRKRAKILPWFFILLFFVISSFSLAHALKYGLLKLEIAKLDNVEVAGADYINANRLKFELETYLGENIFAIQDAEIKEIAQNFPGINSLNIQRIFPDKIRLVIDECKPIAYVKESANRYLLIDENGKILEEKNNPEEYSFPVITKLNLQNLTLGAKIENSSLNQIIEVYKIIETEYPDLLRDIQEFYYSENGVALTEMKRGIKFIVGKDSFQSRVEKLNFAYSNFSINSFSEIDLRFSDLKNELIILR